MFLLHKSLSCSLVVSDSISESAAAKHPVLTLLWRRWNMIEVSKGREGHENFFNSKI